MPLPPAPPAGRAMLPPDTYAGQVVAITGGGTGLGKAMAVEFARAGASVAILSRKEEQRRRGVEAVQAAGGRAADAACDVRDAAQIAAAFDAIERALGPIDVLVNNAAGNFPVAAEDVSPNGWRAVVQIVLDGTFFCSHEFAKRRIAASRPGAILNIGATYAFSGGPGAVHSAAAKAGVHNLTMTLAVEWAQYGIRVNGICPGPILAEALREYLAMLAREREVDVQVVHDEWAAQTALRARQLIAARRQSSDYGNR